MTGPMQTQSPTLTSLPGEILYQIACCFQDQRVLPDGLFEWDPSSTDESSDDGAERLIARQAIASLRLTCRALHTAASPLLFPLLDLDVSNASLSRLSTIAQNPNLARGVRAISIDLAHPPAEIASSLKAFIDFRRSELGTVTDGCQHPTIHDCPHPDATSVRKAIKLAWSAELEGKVFTNERTQRYRLGLRRGYEAFKHKSDEQLNLISTGAFASSLASALSIMPCLAALKLYNGPQWPPYWNKDPWAPLSHTEDLSSWLPMPLPWYRIERMHGHVDPRLQGPGLLPTRLLTDIPVALGRAGVSLRQFDVACLPALVQSITLLDEGGGTAWADDLREALRGLEAVSISTGGSDTFPPHPLAHEARKLEEYLCAAVSSPRLRQVKVSLPQFFLREGPATQRFLPFTLGPAVYPLVCQSKRLEELTLEYGSLEMNGLEHLCSSLGPALKQITICGVAILSGEEEKALSVVERIRKRGFEPLVYLVAWVDGWDVRVGEWRNAPGAFDPSMSRRLNELLFA